MATFRGTVFEDCIVSLDGRSFEGCTFDGCTLVYGGGEAPKLARTRFSGCAWAPAHPTQERPDFLPPEVDGPND